jgi:predicted nuclease with TOPRIM domain
MAKLCDKYALFRIALRETRETLDYSNVLSEYYVNCINRDDIAKKCIDRIFKSLETNKEQDGEVKEKYLEWQIMELNEEKQEQIQKTQELEEKNQELSEKLKEFNDDMMCEACYENLISTVLIPCGHAALCKKCVEKMQTDTTKPFECISCRALPASVITLYMKVLPK